MLLPGERVGSWVVEESVGEGGMAEVYRIRHAELPRTCALKLLRVRDPMVQERLRREGRAQAGLRHPNLVSASDVVQVDGRTGLVMDYVAGPTLKEWLGRERPPLARALALFRGILAGVAEAHARGFVHRDLKPANILLEPLDEGYRPRITDFGLVKVLAGETATAGFDEMTRSGLLLGTPGYMAPEQVDDPRGVDHRADLFALGCILYELCCGRSPFSRDRGTAAVLNAAALGDYRDPPRSLPRPVALAIHACLRPEPHRRVKNCAALQRLLAGDAELVRAFSHLAPRRGGWRPPRAVSLAAAGLAVAGLAALAIGVGAPGIPSRGGGPRSSPPAPEPEVPASQADSGGEPGSDAGAIPPTPTPREEAGSPGSPALAPPSAAEAPLKKESPSTSGPTDDWAAVQVPRATPPPRSPTEGQVLLETGARLICLQQGEGPCEPPGDGVAPGQYRIEALFEGESAFVHAGDLSVVAGGRYRVLCDPGFRVCTVEAEP